jgi:mannose-1-phosphate guanylyltransferase
VVLAAGSGTRLAQLTTDSEGNAVPKQFCSLEGGASLLQEAIQRARRVAPLDRICVIVAAQHRCYWQHSLRMLSSSNLIIQPANRGTANGVLLSMQSILRRDPLARIVFLPADHYVRDERVLGDALCKAAALVTSNSGALALIGLEPEEPDPGLGYIVPGPWSADGAWTVERFVEKPPLPQARQLLLNGALWNSFIFAVSAPALLAHMRRRLGSAADDMAKALAFDGRTTGSTGGLTELYERLPATDFSRDVIEGAEDFLRVVPARACGWSDLGTPHRVAEILRRLHGERASKLASRSREIKALAGSALINLAAQHVRLGLTG